MRMQLYILLTIVLGSGGAALGDSAPPPFNAGPLAGLDIYNIGPASIELHRPWNVAHSFVEALRKKDWDGASALFATDFGNAHQKQLEDGSIFTSEAGKSVLSVLVDPRGGLTGTSVRGDRAWVTVSSLGSDSGQVGRAMIELVREGRTWRILRFPPSPTAYDESIADTSGQAAGRWFQSMISDGTFTAGEQAELQKVLGNYYGVHVVVSTRTGSNPAPVTDLLSGVDMRDLVMLDGEIRRQTELQLQSITFWRSPTPEIESKSRVLVKDALQKVYDALTGARDKFPELAELHSWKLTDESLSYRPIRSIRANDKSLPLFSLSIGKPYLGTTQMAFSRLTYLPSQRLAVCKQVPASDKGLAAFVDRCIDDSIRSLLDYEKMLPGSPGPVQQNW